MKKCKNCNEPLQDGTTLCIKCGAVNDRLALGETSTSNIPDAMPPANSISSTDETSYPALDSWKLSGLFTFLGIVTPALVMALLTLLISYGIDSNSEVLVVLSCTLAIICGLAIVLFLILYPGLIYPSYFDTDPAFKSPKVISFLNAFACIYGFFGLPGICFLCLFNHNLTRKSKGTSNIVFVILFLLSLAVGAYYVFW